MIAASASPGQIATLILPADTAWNEADGIAEVGEISQRAALSGAAVDNAAKILKSGEPTLILMSHRALREDGLALAAQIAARSPTAMRAAKRLLDLGTDRFSVYAGGGFGRARAKLLGNRDDAWAHQLIAGARFALSDNIDFGLKYRYFRTNRLELGDSETTVVQGNPDLLNLGTTSSPVFAAPSGPRPVTISGRPLVPRTNRP